MDKKIRIYIFLLRPFLLAEKGITASNKVLYNSGRMYLYGIIPNTTQYFILFIKELN